MAAPFDLTGAADPVGVTVSQKFQHRFRIVERPAHVGVPGKVDPGFHRVIDERVIGPHTVLRAHVVFYRGRQKG